MTAFELTTVLAAAPSTKFNSELVAVTPSKILSSAVVEVTPSNLFISAVVAETPSRIFSSVAVDVTFAGVDITTGAPVIGSPAITQNHVLGSNNILAGVMTLDGLVRFVWEEQPIGAETWTDQTVSAETWVEAA